MKLFTTIIQLSLIIGANGKRLQSQHLRQLQQSQQDNCYSEIEDYGVCLVSSNGCDVACSNITLPVITGSETSTELCELQDDMICPIVDCCPKCSNQMLLYVQCISNAANNITSSSSAASYSYSICPDVQCNSTTAGSSSNPSFNSSASNGINNTSGSSGDSSGSNSDVRSSCFSKISSFADCMLEKECESTCTSDSTNTGTVPTLTGTETAEEICDMQQTNICPIVNCCVDCKTEILDYFQCLLKTSNTNGTNAITATARSADTNPLSSCTLTCDDTDTTKNITAPTSTSMNNDKEVQQPVAAPTTPEVNVVVTTPASAPTAIISSSSSTSSGNIHIVISYQKLIMISSFMYIVSIYSLL